MKYIIWAWLWTMILCQAVSAQQFTNRIFLKVYNHHAASLPPLDAFKPDAPVAQPVWENLEGLLARYGVSRINRAFHLSEENLRNTYLLEVSEIADPDLLIAALEQLSFIEYAEPVPVYEMDYQPNDYNFSNLYHLDVIQAQAAWNISKGDSAVVIAVVDNAFRIDHEDLAANIWFNPGEIPGNGIDDEGNGYVDDVNGYDVSDNDNDPSPPNASFNHGTHVAGCAAAVTDNGKGIAGIGFNCSIMPVKSKSNSSPGSTLDNTFEGLQYAIASGADIISMSFGGAGFSSTWQNLINAGHAQGIIFVGSAGNTGQNEVRYPASYDHVINVGATNSDDRKANYSTYGPTVDVMAPGTSIRSTMPASISSYGNQSGTSMATPIVAGLLGLMKSVSPCLTPDELEIALKLSCDNIDAVNGNYLGNIGAGRVNAAAALTLLGQQNAPVAAFAVKDTFTCAGEVALNYQIDSSQLACIDSYQWLISDGQSYADTLYTRDPVLTVPGSGSYSVQLIVGNTLGTDTALQQIQIAVGMAPQANAGANISLCLGDTVRLTATTDQPGSSIYWFPETGLSNADTLNPLLTARGGLNYVLTVESADGCIGRDTFQLTTLPNPTILTLPLNGATIAAGDSVQLNALGASTWSWSPVAGLSNPNIANPKASPDTTTTYLLTGYNQQGCAATQPLLITVNEITGLAAQALQGLGTLYLPKPNPVSTSTVLAAELMQAGELTITLTDMNGKQVAQVFSGDAGQGHFELQWQRNEALASGIYFVNWVQGGLSYVQKIRLR